jgi:hypothetical protein
MPAIKNINIGVRVQAIGVITLMVLWYLSVWLGLHKKGFVSSLNDFWNFVFGFFPFIAAVFAATMVASYFMSGRPHRWWVRVAFTAAISPWILFCIFYLNR